MKDKRLKDLIIFTKIISTGFLVGGFALMGLLIGKKLVDSGWPPWVNFAAPLIFTLFGLHQGWVVIKSILNKSKK